jgi:hypothetical protein
MKLLVTLWTSIQEKLGSNLLDHHPPWFFSVPTDDCQQIGHSRVFPHPFQFTDIIYSSTSYLHVLSNLTSVPASKYSSQNLSFVSSYSLSCKFIVPCHLWPPVFTHSLYMAFPSFPSCGNHFNCPSTSNHWTYLVSLCLRVHPAGSKMFSFLPLPVSFLPVATCIILHVHTAELTNHPLT